MWPKMPFCKRSRASIRQKGRRMSVPGHTDATQHPLHIARNHRSACRNRWSASSDNGHATCDNVPRNHELPEQLRAGVRTPVLVEAARAA